MFNLPHATRVRGGLRVARLQAALDAWVARYPALQGAIVEQDGEPQMRIDPTARVVVQVDQTLRGLAPEPQAAALAARLHALAAAPFALEVAPLLRATWIALDDDDGVLVFVAHHLIIDGWSAARLIAQLQDRWQAPDEVFGAPGAVALPAWRVQQALARCPLQHAYWMARLADIEALALPTDRPRPAEPSFAGGVRHFSVAAPVWRAVKAAAAAARVTPFVWLLASFQVMLMRLSGQHDITVGTPVAARARAGFDDQIGMWTYTVPLRTDLSGRPSMAELVERMAPRVLDDLAHHEFDLDAVVRAYGMPRELNRNPIYQVGFAFQSMGPLALNLPGFACTPVAVHTGTARTDLWLALEGRDDGLHGEFEFNRALFDASTIDAYARAFVQLLEAGVRAPEQPVHALSLLDAAERQRVLVDFNASDARFDGPAFVHDWIAAQAARTPQAVAVQFGTQTLCYAELQTQAYQLAHRLQQLGVRPGDFVGVSLERSFALVVGVLGIFHAGAVYVPMDPTLPTDRLRFMLDDTRAQVVLVQRGASAGVMWRVAHPLFMDDPAERARQATLPATSPAVALTAESPAYVIYTSGSTGQPKGVVIGHGAMRNHKCWNIRVVGLTAQDRVLHKTTISFDASVWELLTPLMVGGAVVLARPGDQRDTYRLVRTVRECGITHLTMTPSAARALLSEPELADCHTLRWLLCGGEVLDAALVQALMARRPGLTVGNFYGPSEATEDTSCHVMTAPPPGGEPVPVGRPVANTQCYVLDAERQPLPAGLRGELWIGGAGVALGYLNRPDLTAERFTDNPWASGRLYRTGDLGRWRSSGVLDVSGRVDHQIKLRGFRIELGEIEHALRACPGVAEAAVVVREDRPGMRALIAYVAGPAGAEAALAGDELRRVLAEHLPEYMVPTVWVVLPRLPRLPNGKLDRQQLPAPAEASAARSARPPQGDTEVLVWRLWAEVLGTERFDALDNFFALGGHSLLLTQVASRLRDRHGIDLPLRTLFAAPTVADLAASIEAARQAGGPGAASVPPAAAGAPGKVSRDAALLASYSQRRMWLVQQFDPETTAYNVSVSAHLRGDFDRAAFVRAAQWLVDRHEAFRTRFEVRGGEPLQRIDAQGGLALHEADLTALAPEARREAARRMLRERGATRFDLAAGPLHTWTLLRLGEGEWVFGLVMHHAVCDNWSITVLLRDFLAAYVGTPPATDATRLDYADFAVWQRQQLDTRVLSPQIEYWRHQLAGARASELPTDRPRPLHLDASGARLRVSVPDHLQQRLLTVSAALHATPFMVLLACFQVLVGRYTQDDDIVLGSPIANRHWPGSEAIVGTLVNTLVMRTSLAGNPRFDELVARTRQTAIDAYAHQDVSYDLLIETLAQEQTTRPEFVRLMFNVLNAPLGRVSYSGLVVDEFDFDRVSAQFDLSIHADLELDQVLYLEYSTALFERATAERFLANYLALLEQVLQAPQRFIHDYRVPTAMELRQLDAWNARGQAYEASLLLPAAFHARARVQRDAPAIRTQTDVWRYGELSDAAHRIARGLRAAGIGRGQRVGVCVERSPAMVAAQLGILEAGAAYVPLDPGFPAERLGYMAEDAVLAVVIVQPDTAALFAGQTCLALSDLLSADLPPLPLADDPARDARPNDAAYVIYTSGSTGRPKGVVVHHQGVMNFLWSMAKTPGMTAHDHVLAVTTISFDIAVLELFLPLVVGGQISLATREQAGDAHALRQWLDQHPITLMQATPSTWRMLIDAGWQGRQGFKALVGGEALPPDLARALLDRVDALWNMYGPTETTVWSTCCRVEAPDRGIRIGEPIANTTVHVLDARGERCPIGVPGEIYIGGDGVTLGYWQRPTLTAERFVADPFGADSAHTDAFGASAPVDGLPPRLYRTGDRGRWMADGQLEHLGRLDFQVKVRGYRIELGEIETVLRTHPAVRDAVVVVREERVGDARLVAYYVADAAVLAGALRDHLRERLPDYMLPQAYMALDQIPLLPNGKVNRQALPVPEAAAPAHRDDVLAPSTPAEQAIAQIWRTLLGIEDISVNDSFFDLGGHSLLAMRAVIEIERALGVRVAPRRLIYETLAQLAANLEGA